MNNDSELPDIEAMKGQMNPFVESSLFKSRTCLITGEINDRQARAITERLLAMAGENDEPITLIVSSPGGHVESGDMIHDMIKYIKPRVRTLGTGWVASAGALIYVSADREDRFCLPNTRFLLHEPRGGIGGSATEIDIQAREVLRMRERLNHIFADATGQPLEKIVKDTTRDHWMNAEEAREYGVVGKIIHSAAEIV
ncbi:MAG: ATP-dependent Clp protease proteolytic subunit [Alphaproteobacteria bacterium HGW-Alphaproteobacteria-12]|nr:MAG: ATP-dependent Clp protease proteolytic subunit [Alphaproteobacteria bacterium HGW-Alphaproteobacteria-12]